MFKKLGILLGKYKLRGKKSRLTKTLAKKKKTNA